MNYNEFIHDRGRGPEIKGTRITVYSILDCLLECWPKERIADWFDLKDAQIEAAIVFIRENTIEVLAEYLKILQRSAARGNPPDVKVELSESRQQFRELVERIHSIKNPSDTDIQALIREFRESRQKEAAHAGNHGGQ